MLSLESQVTPILSQKTIIDNIFKLRRIAADKKLAYLTDVQCE